MAHTTPPICQKTVERNMMTNHPDATTTVTVELTITTLEGVATLSRSEDDVPVAIARDVALATVQSLADAARVIQ